MTAYTLGIDVGTTGTKTVLVNSEGGIAAQTTRESELFSPRAGYAEADPDSWRRNVVDSIREVLLTSGVPAREVVGLATTGMVPAVLPIGSDGSPLRRAILQNDARATEEIEEVAAALSGIDVVSLTGSAVTQQSVAPTALWLQRNEPEVWAATAALMGSYDWILVSLGAESHVEFNWALESGLFTLDGEVFPDALEAGRIDSERLPRVLRPGEIAGALSDSAAAETGLLRGTPLVVGGADHVLSAYAAGVESPGDCLIKLGGAGDVLVATDRRVVDSRLYLDAHPTPGRWLPNGCMATSGSLIRWFQKLTGGEELGRLDLEAQERAPASLLCLPYFLGEKSPLHDPDLRGAFFGLHLGHTRADLYRAVLEAIAFGFRHHVEVYREMGLDIGRVLVTNGGSKSTLWKQIHADVLDTTLFPVTDHPGASLGAALSAAVGVGALDSWASSTQFVRLGSAVEPSPERSAEYSRAYAEWRELGEITTPLSHAIARRIR